MTTEVRLLRCTACYSVFAIEVGAAMPGICIHCGAEPEALKLLGFREFLGIVGIVDEEPVAVEKKGEETGEETG